ncbi:NmrA family NAD(P)-binding protein [Novosphingobium soli]|uniref:NmrA family NAD(P)-binding protein n=1 Tax=Novosphingobium soli TaxID=574956 RepID=UPI003630EB1D
MRILVVGPTGRTGSHVVEALRRRDPNIAIRGLCRYPDQRARSIEVVPGNDETGTHRGIEVVPGNDETGAKRTIALVSGAGGTQRSIEVVPGNDETGTTRGIEVVPGNDETGTTRAIEVVPGNDETGTTRAIEVVPGNDETGTTRGIEVVPGNDETGTTRGIEVVPGNDETGTTRAIEVVPGNDETGTTRGIEVVPGNDETGTTRGIEVVPGNDETGTTRAIEVVPGNDETGTGLRLVVDVLIGDLENPIDRAAAVNGVDVVIHYAPAFHPREAAMGTGMIDAAVAAGVKRFIYVSALQASAPGVPGHAAKLAVEGHLAGSGLEWTILRPQSYMQNVDVAGVVLQGALALPAPAGMPQGHVDLADLAEVIAKIVFEKGHAYATYDIASDEALSTAEIAGLIASASGGPVTAGELPLTQLRTRLGERGHAYSSVIEGWERLSAWQVRTGGRGNGNVLRWLLGREPARFEDYVRRSLGAA